MIFIIIAIFLIIIFTCTINIYKKIKIVDDKMWSYIATPCETIFNVTNFNNWFCDPNNNAVYAHSGIYGRCDKLSIAHIEDYMLKCYGINDKDKTLCHGHSKQQLIDDFYQDIRKDWLK